MAAPGGVKAAADAHYAKRLSGGGACGPGDGETKWAEAMAAPGGVKTAADAHAMTTANGGLGVCG